MCHGRQARGTLGQGGRQRTWARASLARRLKRIYGARPCSRYNQSSDGCSLTHSVGRLSDPGTPSGHCRPWPRVEASQKEGKHACTRVAAPGRAPQPPQGGGDGDAEALPAPAPNLQHTTATTESIHPHAFFWSASQGAAPAGGAGDRGAGSAPGEPAPQLRG